MIWIPRPRQFMIFVPAFRLLACLLAAGPGTQAEETAQNDARELFLRHVQPLLQEKCLACHGKDPAKLKGKLDLRTRAGMLKGGESGEPALVPGNPEKSKIHIAIRRTDPELAMPPKENDKLSEKQMEWVRRWIAGGAPWPAATEVATADIGSLPSNMVAVATSGGQSPAWTNRLYRDEDLWCYRPAQIRAAPAVDAAGGNPIDAFLLGKLREKGIKAFAQPADKRTLIRRATVDLTGVPPAPEEIERFVQDQSPDSYARLVQRLLASPHYGEQWARHWLDVARYADTGGFSNDFERPNAWRYRDYVIRSLNADKPYDRFVLEQVAGDELDAKDPEMLIAAGFLRMGPWEHTAMTPAAVTRQQWLDDVTHSVGVTFLAQGLRCARCHDHKFDPVPTRDYYRIQACFASTQFAERPAPFLAAEDTAPFAGRRAEAESRFNKELEGLAQFKNRTEAAQPGAGPGKLELTLKKVREKHRQYFEREMKRYEPFAFSVYSGASNGYSSVKLVNSLPVKDDGAVAPVKVLPGGALESPGEIVSPGVLSAVPNAAATSVPDTSAGRRLALARWIASRENTLTARVIVNRVWQWHFGTGLAGTPNNFGKMGARPSHPELLDWLANGYMDNGWSLKKLHALIMTSAAYRQSGDRPDMNQALEFDPKNALLAYFPMRRLEAEEIRDAMLAASGELNLEMCGPGIFPEINWEVALQPRHVMGSVAPAYQPSRAPRERNRRTIYAFRYRTLADPMLTVFNLPGSDISCERRDETTVTPQAFALFNSNFSAQRALALAALVQKSGATPEERIGHAFQRVVGRSPNMEEMNDCLKHVARQLDYHKARQPVSAALITRIKRNMVEEMTGEDILWEEELENMKSYQRDLQPADVEPEVRALADLCLVLMNSNEFLYLR